MEIKKGVIMENPFQIGVDIEFGFTHSIEQNVENN